MDTDQHKVKAEALSVFIRVHLWFRQRFYVVLFASVIVVSSAKLFETLTAVGRKSEAS
jgi:hypothetical protein